MTLFEMFLVSLGEAGTGYRKHNDDRPEAGNDPAQVEEYGAMICNGWDRRFEARYVTPAGLSICRQMTAMMGRIVHDRSLEGRFR